MASWRQRMAKVGALGLALTAASPSFPQSGSAADQSGVVIFWDAAKCAGAYETNSYSVHCEPGPFGTVLDFKTKMQFFCVNNEAVDVRWAIPADAKPGPPIPPSQITWSPECWKAPLGFDVDPNTTILTPQYRSIAPAQLLYDHERGRSLRCGQAYNKGLPFPFVSPVPRRAGDRAAPKAGWSRRGRRT
jgi:hypothetical protein